MIFVQVSKALVHPGYDSRVLANDIALLVLETRAQVGGFISLENKNRLCSMTCGIDKICKIDRLDTKRFFLYEKKRSHPKEKSG